MGGPRPFAAAPTQQHFPDEPPEEVRQVGGAGEASRARSSLDDAPV